MIRTMLTIKKHTLDNRIVVMHKDWSRSFTRGLMTGLYLRHANIVNAAAIPRQDVRGDIAVLCTNGSALRNPNLFLFGGTARTNTLFSNTVSAGGAEPSYGNNGRPGHLFGIQIGGDNTAADARDFGLKYRIHHGTNPAVTPAATMYSMVQENADGSNPVTNGHVGCVFRPYVGMHLTAVIFKCFRVLNPGNVTVKIWGWYPSDGNTTKIGNVTPIATSNVVNANLWGAASPGAEIQFDFATPVELTNDQSYVIAITPSQAAAGNYVAIRYHNAPAAPIPVRLLWATVDASTPGTVAGLGTNPGWVPYFKAIGTSLGDMEYGGNDLYGLTVVDPNASFNIRRIFTNNSGGAITVKESGIYALLGGLAMSPGGGNANAEDNLMPYCIARDTFADIAVADSENLEVIYTPSITV